MNTLRKIIKNTIIACIPFTILSTINANSSPLRRSKSSPNITFKDMFNENFRKIFEFGQPIITTRTSASVSNLNDTDDFQKLRNEMIFSNNARAMQNGVFPRPMWKLYLDESDFVDTYTGLKMPRVNNATISNATKVQYFFE